MYTLLAQLARLVPAFAPANPHRSLARTLLETAEARAGSDPHEARELRDAAYAYLRVVR
jgi:hypothetical protein